MTAEMTPQEKIKDLLKVYRGCPYSDDNPRPCDIEKGCEIYCDDCWADGMLKLLDKEGVRIMIRKHYDNRPRNRDTYIDYERLI